jgi:hypothetical protein
MIGMMAILIGAVAAAVFFLARRPRGGPRRCFSAT